MNINLQSPKKNNNGYNYNVRFRENITIKKNSKVYLNYATFSRESEVFFSEDQKITLTDMEFLPEKLPGTPASDNLPSITEVTIPAVNPETNKKGYSFDDLQKTISDKFLTLRNQNQLAAYNVFSEDTAFALKDSDVGMGFYIEQDPAGNTPIEAFEVDVNHTRGAASDAENVYFKNTASGSKTTPFTYGYDSYALSDVHYFHPMVSCPDDDTSSSFIDFKLKNSINDQDGAVTLALYSSEYIGAAGTNNTERTGGTAATVPNSTNSNPQVKFNDVTVSSTDTTINFTKARIASFLTVEITPLNTKGVNRGTGQKSISVYVPKNAVGASTIINTWDSINKNIYGMKRVYTSRIDPYTPNDDTPLHVRLETYYTNQDGNLNTTNRKLYFRLINLTKGGSTTDRVNLMFDSKRSNVYFPMSFFTGLSITGTDPQKAERLNSRIPFQILLAAQSQNDGFEKCDFVNFDKTKGTNNDPFSILLNYKLKFTEELSRYIGGTESDKLWPNACEFEGKFLHIKNFTLDWFNDSYSILLKNLPIKNYKNTDEESNGGFGKAILANIPTPFKDTIEQIVEDKKVITGIYQPSYPVILDLKNQETELNNFDISIVNISNEQEVTQLIKSNISFTIQE
jgi:hypothetical protein